MKKTAAASQVAQFFDLWADAGGYPHYKKEEYLSVLDTCEAIRVGGKRVLDVGCGVGFVASGLKERGNHVTGLDLSSAALNQALQNRLIDHGVVADFNRSGLPESSFDVVVCWGVLMLIFDMQAAFREAHRILKPGGTLFVVDHYAGNPYTMAHFGRPNWMDIFIEGNKNVDRHPLSPTMVQDAGGELYRWEEPNFHSMFTEHPNLMVNSVHSIARTGFSLIRKVTEAPWTGNFMSMVGRKI